MIGVSNQLLLTLITLLISTSAGKTFNSYNYIDVQDNYIFAAQAQFTGCFIDSGCTGAVVGPSNAENCCVNNNAGLYYNDGGQCLQCIGIIII